MDSKDVNRAIRARIRPLLKTAGFERFTARTAWRFCGAAIGVVNFQSFNSYIASGVGCTTFSFAINLGCHYTFLPQIGTSTFYDRDNLPQEYHCAFRRALRKSLAQPKFPRPDIWFVEPDGSNSAHVSMTPQVSLNTMRSHGSLDSVMSERLSISPSPMTRSLMHQVPVVHGASAAKVPPYGNM